MQSSNELIEIKDKLWNGSINIKILMEDDNNKDPKEFLITAYRNSYFPIYFPSVIAYFEHYNERIKCMPVWLEYETVPVKWNLPIGALYDLLHLPSIIQDREDSSWTLKLRFSDDYPMDQVIPFIYTNEDNSINYNRLLKEVIVNQLKQSCFVINGNSKPIMNLSEKDSDELWNAIRTHNLKLFDKMNKKIIPIRKRFQKLPVKIYIPGSATIIHAPIYPYSETGEAILLKNILDEYLPDLMNNNDKLGSIYIHGINVESIINKEIINVWDLFKHLDNFLYIIVLFSTYSTI
mmetsp:Transcript_269/g.335  ORF Transcript_269/g.335 Transcript_269/m.335 type:complete len:292 (-) Transcript_269:1018-1893(-)